MALALLSTDLLDEDLPGDLDLPCSDGEPMENPQHAPQIWTLIESLQLGWPDRDDFYVGGNMFLYFSLKQIKKNDFRGPDVFVVLNTRRRKPRRSWVVWKEHRTPALIVELLSPSTERVDRGEKMQIYARQLGVDNYFLYDTESGKLEGYELIPGPAYRPLPLDPSGRIWSPALKLWLGPTDHQADAERFWMLRWFDAKGQMLPTRGEQERARAEQERARAEQEHARAEQERARADALARRLEALEAAQRGGGAGRPD